MAVAPEHSTHADFFVHPDFHTSGWYPEDPEVNQFESALRRRIEASPLPVLIHDPEAVEYGDFWDLFPSDQRFMSISNQGYLDDEGDVMPRFNRLLTEQMVGRGTVHGSYLEACVRQFKRSIRVLGETGLLHVLLPDQTESIGDIAEPETVKYGIVLSARNKRRGAYPEFEGLESGLPTKYYADDAQIFHTSQR